MLKLNFDHLQIMQIHAETIYPEECCGILIGQMQGDTKTLIEVLPTENSWGDEAVDDFQNIATTSNKTSKRNRFSIAPKVMFEVQRDTRSRNLDIIGIFHSHPDNPAHPSEFDRAIAWQSYSYIIVSVQNGKTCDLKSWILDDNHKFQPEEIIIVSPKT